jgi:hypothetical protein
MIDHPSANVVSNSSSHNSFVGLTTRNDDKHNLDQMSYVNNPLANLPPSSSEPQNQASTVSEMNTTMHTPVNTSYQPSQVFVSKSPMPILPSTELSAPSATNTSTVPEFLYQLTKMLTGGHDDIIEWSNGRIEVHNPHKLESVVLQKYFRHSKFASFQRQLNYFGFRKLAGKGKMAPCSYVNDAATHEISSLLQIKVRGDYRRSILIFRYDTGTEHILTDGFCFLLYSASLGPSIQRRKMKERGAKTRSTIT